MGYLGLFQGIQLFAQCLELGLVNKVVPHDRLLEEGYAVSRQGSGTFVAETLPEEHLSVVSPRPPTSSGWPWKPDCLPLVSMSNYWGRCRHRVSLTLRAHYVLPPVS